MDTGLGVVGLVLLVVGLVAVSNIQGDAAHTAVGLAMLVWVVVISWRHRAVHRGGRGAGLLVMSWVALGLMVLWAVVQSLDTAAFDDGVLDGLGSLASSPPAVVLVVPLVLAVAAILRDRSTAT